MKRLESLRFYEMGFLAYNRSKKQKRKFNMKISLRNKITLDGQIEVLDQEYPVELVEKKDQLYLIFHNEEKEKTIIKCDETELVMTRFSSPKSIMRFRENKDAVVILHTPLGIQHFVTDTKYFLLDRDQQSLTLHYDLKQLEGDGIFASYQMEIGWG